MKAVAVVIICSLLVSCGGAPLQKQTVGTQDDQYSPSATIVGTKLFDNPFGGVSKEWFIRSFIDKKTGAVTHQLYVETSYIGDWKYYQSANDDTAAPLPFIVIDREVGDCTGGCSLEETFALGLQGSVLRAKAATGYSVKISAHDGTAFILSVPPGQIQPQLAAIDNYLATHHLPSASQSTNAKAAPSSFHPTIGIQALPTPAGVAAALKVSGGLMIVTVTANSPADRAGLKSGDVILKFGNAPINAIADLRAAIAKTSPGATVRIAIQRGTTPMTVPMKLTSGTS